LDEIPKEEKSSFADDFAAETIKLLDDILAKPKPWKVILDAP